MIIEFFVTVLTSAAVSSLLCAGLVWLTREWMSARIRGSIQYEYDQKLESFKAKVNAEKEIALARLTADLEKEAAIMMAANSSFSQGQKAAIERRLDAIDKIWNSILSIRENSPSAFLYLDIITNDEFETIFEDEKFRSAVNKLSKEDLESWRVLTS